MDFLDTPESSAAQAVAAGGGPILVLAGPGSGKTRVLTQRVAFLIAEQKVPAYRIMAVTFTNKAAREMQSRVEKLLGAEATQGMWLGTFHSICARLLRREVALLPLESNFAIFDQDDQERLVKGDPPGLQPGPQALSPVQHAGRHRQRQERAHPGRGLSRSPPIAMRWSSASTSSTSDGW